MTSLKERLGEHLNLAKTRIREKTIVFTVYPACGQPHIRGRLTRDGTIEKMSLLKWQQIKDELAAAIKQSLKAQFVKGKPSSHPFMYSYGAGIKVVTKIGEEWKHYFDHPALLTRGIPCKEECGFWMVTPNMGD
ncbi:MAG: hypothetical protein ACFFFG_11750 [Candidatus Thorarchaeota archaeon]